MPEPSPASPIISLDSEGTDSGRFIALGEWTAARPPEPAFMFGPVPDAVMDDYYTTTDLHAPGVYQQKGLTVSEGFLLHRGGFAYSLAQANIHPEYVSMLIEARAARESPASDRRIAGMSALIAGPGLSVYGHWIVDLLPKITLLELAGFDLHSLQFPLPADIPPFALEWLSLLGIKDRQLLLYQDYESLETETLLIPTTLHNGARVSALFAEVPLFILKQLGIDPPGARNRRLFLSRAQASQSRQLLNRDAIETMAESAGMTRVAMEMLPLREQVALFSTANQIVGEYGSAMHGSIFAPMGTQVACLRGSEFHPAFIQSGLGEVLRMPTGYIFGDTDPNTEEQAFTVAESAFAEYLQDSPPASDHGG